MLRGARRRLALATALVAVPAALVLAAAPAGRASPVPTRCTLVLSAMPSEVGPILDRATRRGPAVTVDGRRFFPGRLMGRDVVVTMSGIGLVNAEEATRAAVAAFDCIRGIVVSGVGGGQRIGDVVVPDRWTEDGQRTYAVDPTMRAAAERASAGGRLSLSRRTPLGDPACICDLPLDVATIQHDPEVAIGGLGISTDPFAGEQLPCIPGGGDIFGCDPCGELRVRVPDVAAVGRLLTSGFLAGYLSAPPALDDRYASQDMETARVAAIAEEHGLPFIAFRAVSDGGGDPYGLPGFPLQFALYRQLAADNAAIATLAFLEQWAP